MKTFSTILKGVAAICIMLSMAACGNNLPSPEEVANRINTGESLSEKDYSQMIEYCGVYSEKAQKYFDIINAQPNDSTAETIKATDQLAALYGEYTYIDLFRGRLEQTELSQLGAENEKKVNGYAKYEAFPLPIGAGEALENPDVVGMIEQTPEDSSAVIATGAGEAVDVQVK